jgi:hypothetical protein
MHSTRRPDFAPALVLAALCAAPLAAHPLEAAAMQPGEPPVMTIDLNFAGGTVSEYAAAVRAAARNINIVLSPGAGEFTVPPVELRHAFVPHAMKLLEYLAHHPHGRLMVRHEHENPMFADMFIVAADIRRPTISPTELETRVYSLVGIIDEQVTAADVLAAIEAALGLLEGEYQPAKIRLHEATGLLIVRAHPMQVFHVDEVMEQLTNATAQRRQIEVNARQREQSAPAVEIRRLSEENKRLRDALERAEAGQR